MPRQMSEDERRAFLLWGTRTAKVASVREDGRPHVAPVWFVLDGNDIIFLTGSGTVKGRDIRRDGRLALLVDDDRPPYSFALMEGSARVSEDLGEMREWSVQIAARYMGHDRAEEVGERNAVPGELLVRVAPSRVTAMADMAD